MIRPIVRAVDKEKEGEVSRAMSVQLTAFSSDPCMRWLCCFLHLKFLDPRPPRLRYKIYS